MEFEDYLAAVTADGDRLAAVADLGLDMTVPSCPGWTVADLVGHTGMVHRHKVQIVDERWIDGMPIPVEPPDRDLVAWYREGLDLLVATLAAHDPGERVATWYPEDQSVGFWYRRMAAETVVHRVDAELAHGVVSPIAPAAAADAVDEILVVMMTGYPDWSAVDETPQTVRVESTDTDDAWTMRFITFSGTSPKSGMVFEAEPSLIFVDEPDPTAIVSGSAEDVLLFLWGRRGPEGLTVVGDSSVLDQLRSIATDVTQ